MGWRWTVWSDSSSFCRPFYAAYRSRRKLLEGTGALLTGEEKPIFAETFYNHGKETLFTKEFKVTHNEEGYKVYDLNSDPGETYNLLNSDLELPVIEKVVSFKENLSARTAQDKLKLGAPMLRTFSQRLLDRIRALGYVQ